MYQTYSTFSSVLELITKWRCRFISKANYQIYKDVTELTLAGYIAYLQGMYKRYGNISIAQLKHIERNRKKEDNQ